MNIYDYDDYKIFVNQLILNMKRNGHGQYRRMAEHLRVHPTLVSQIFNGQRDLTLEQAAELSSYFQLDTSATEYFLTLVQIQRAGSVLLKEILTRRKESLRPISKAPANFEEVVTPS